MLIEINEFQSGPDKNTPEDGRIYSARRCYSENEADISVSWSRNTLDWGQSGWSSIIGSSAGVNILPD